MDLTDLSEAEQVIVREGLQAADLLDNDCFQSTMRSLLYEYFSQFTEKPSAADRDAIYNKVQVLQDLEATLHTRVQSKDAIVRRLDALAEELDDDTNN